MAEEPTTPPEAPTPPPPPTAKSGTGLDPNVAGFLCYLAGWITGLIFYLTEKENDYVRFHAMQSIIFSVGLFVVYIGLVIVQTILSFIPYIGWLISLVLTLAWVVVGIGAFVFWIILMIKAYQGERYKLPVLGDMAEKYI
jgi:uncharacterized membrane protein